MKTKLKPLFGILATTLLLIGCSVPEKEADAKQEPNPTKETRTMIFMKTTQGDIHLELDNEQAPHTVSNFLHYVKNGHYNGTIFHRVINNFMIQGGGFTADMTQKNAPHTVDNEANNGLKNLRGTIAMARTSDPHSAGAQFFINVVDNGFLDFKAPTQQGWGYCVFGKVVEGMNVVDAIRSVPTGRIGGFSDVPQSPITIIEVSVMK